MDRFESCEDECYDEINVGGEVESYIGMRTNCKDLCTKCDLC